MSIKKIIEAIDKIKGEVYIGEGEFDEFSCEYNPPANESEIAQFEQRHNVKLHDDYKEFLSICNGLQLFNSGDFSLYGLNEIEENLKINNFLENILPIGYVLEDMIILNCDENCIYAGDSCSTDEFYSLECDFETFLDRWLHSNGEKYWNWFEPNEYYTFIKN